MDSGEKGPEVYPLWIDGECLEREVQQEREREKKISERDRKRCTKDEEKDFPGDPVVKNLPANAEDAGSILGRWGN